MTSKYTGILQDGTVESEVLDERKAQTDNPEQTLESIMDGLAATVLAASDEEIIAELQKQGRDPIREAEDVRKILLDALKDATSETTPESQRSPKAAIP
jgi:hypothetical protein